MLVEKCDITRVSATSSTSTGRQKRSFETIAAGVKCLIQPRSGSSGQSDGSGLSDPGFLQSYNWIIFLPQGQDIRDGDRVVSSSRSLTLEVATNTNIITPSFTTGHHIEVKGRQMIREAP